MLPNKMMRLFIFLLIYSLHMPVIGKLDDQAIKEMYKEAKVLVAITFHFNQSRLEYLKKVLASLATFPKIDIIILTNTFDENEISAIQDLYTSDNNEYSLSIRSCGNLEHPFLLTWCHKDIIANEFVKNNQGHTHFIYLEDDMSFNFKNFKYFIKYREKLKKQGLLPSFLRVEYHRKKNTYTNTDNFKAFHVMSQPHVKVDDYLFVNPPNPYMACFVLDRKLALEYFHSSSFDRNKCIIPWGVRERAAAGLCFENIPKSFSSRYVVPVSLKTQQCPKCAWIYHLPNNYALDPSSNFGKAPMDSLFIMP